MTNSQPNNLLLLLKKHGISPNKNLGQCFLISEKALDEIVTAASITPGERVLEIGGGTGILSERILEKGGLLTIVEKDTRLKKILEERFGKYIKDKKLEIIHSDFLKIPFPKFFQEKNWEQQEYKVVSNLPYQITSPVLERLIERNFLPKLIVLTIQKEVAQRICAKSGELSSIGVLIQSCAKEVKIVDYFPPGYFYPSPEVDSALIKISKIDYPKGIDIKSFRKIVRQGFQFKRKKLINNLSSLIGKEETEEIWGNLKLDRNIRAQDLEIDKWIDMANLIKSKI